MTTKAPVHLPATGKPARRPRLAVWLLGGLALLLLLAYAVAASPAFFKGVILPRIAKALSADITVSHASIRPFDGVVLRGLRVRPLGASRCLAIPELRVRYSLLDLLRGKILVELAAGDPALPGEPPEATLRLDAGLHAKVLELRQCLLTLRPTGRDPNQAQLTGTLDLRDRHGVRGNLCLAAGSLDLTRCCGLFLGWQPPAPAARPVQDLPAQAGPEARPEPGPQHEPSPRQLPFRGFRAEIAVHRLRLGKIQLGDWKATATIDGGHVVIAPWKLTVNGAPMAATLDLDLGVPGFKYAFVLDAERIPLAPIIDTLQPQWRGTLNGTLTAQAEVRGAGVTGAGLKRNLTGRFDLASTNLDLSVQSIPGDTLSTRLLKTLMSAIALIPDFAKGLGGPEAAPAGREGPGAAGAPTLELSKSPINSIILHGTAGAGRVQLSQTLVQGPAFETLAGGTVTFNDVLTNSPVQIPVAVFLERGLARKLRFSDAGAPSGGAYVRLPDFLTLKGTLGKPSSHVDTKKLTSSPCKQS